MAQAAEVALITMTRSHDAFTLKNYHHHQQSWVGLCTWSFDFIMTAWILVMKLQNNFCYFPSSQSSIHSHLSYRKLSNETRYLLVHMRWHGLPAVCGPPLVDAVSTSRMYILASPTHQHDIMIVVFEVRQLQRDLS